jgi:hypothetical protein
LTAAAVETGKLKAFVGSNPIAERVVASAGVDDVLSNGDLEYHDGCDHSPSPTERIRERGDRRQEDLSCPD